ncbi:hypothetical protein FKM82_018101, partial [Ascaphus truei]
ILLVCVLCIHVVCLTARSVPVLFLTGHTLDCYTCDFGTCLFPSKTSCGLLEVCGTETSTTAGFLNFKKKSCVSPLNCLSESSTTYAGVTVKTSASCCLTDLCNSAAIPAVSLVTGIATLLALWLAKLS